MTARHYHPRETLDLLERILAHVESIDTHVETLVDHVDHFDDFLRDDGYGPAQEQNGYA